MPKKIIISGVGCCLVDLLYRGVDFSSDSFRPFISMKRGDGGLIPGQLVFNEEFEKFGGLPFETLIKYVTGDRVPDKVNIGGPSIVSLINAGQLVKSENCEIRFYGCFGNDDTGKFLVDAIKKTPVVLYDYKVSNKITPSTVVLSDPNFDNGNGERIFINSIGAAWDFTPDDLDEDFFKSDLVIFGGTALVPGIHDNLTELLKKAKQNRGITIVNTVFDFRNDKQNPYKKWPLGKSSKSYQYIDLLIADKEEALRLSGKKTIETAITYFLTNKVLAVVITNGINPIWAYSNGKLFEQINLTKFPVSQSILDELKTNTQGDTTGAGDNFAGGIIASIISQLQQNHKILNLTDAITWGIVSGGFACFYMGGAYFENERFEKLKLVKSYYDAYQLQING